MRRASILLVGLLLGLGLLSSPAQAVDVDRPITSVTGNRFIGFHVDRTGLNGSSGSVSREIPLSHQVRNCRHVYPRVMFRHRDINLGVRVWCVTTVRQTAHWLEEFRVSTRFFNSTIARKDATINRLVRLFNNQLDREAVHEDYEQRLIQVCGPECLPPDQGGIVPGPVFPPVPVN